MTDVQEVASDIPTLYKQLMDTIGQLDKELDSTLDSDTAAKTVFINDKIESVSEMINGTVDGFIEQIKQRPVEEQVGLFYGFQRRLNKAFSKDMTTFVENQVKDLPKPTPLITAVEVPAKQKERSELYQSIKQLVELAGKFGFGSFEMPRKRTGKSGKRGPRKLTYFSWSIDGTAFEKLADVVGDLPMYEKVSELTEAMRANKKDSDGNEIEKSGLDLKSPPDRIEFLLPDGRTLIGELDAEEWAKVQATPPSEAPSDETDYGDDDEEGEGEATEEAEAL